MSKVTLDKGYDLELQDGEVIIYADKWGAAELTLKNILGNWYYAAITNKRLALVSKNSSEVETINYNEISWVSYKDPSSSAAQIILKFHEKKKWLGFLPVHKKRTFQLSVKLLEAFKLLGKDMMREAKWHIANMASIADYNQRRQAIQERGDLTEQQKQWAMNEAWANVSKEWGDMFETTAIFSKKPTPKMRRDLMVDLIRQAIKLSENSGN